MTKRTGNLRTKPLSASTLPENILLTILRLRAIPPTIIYVLHEALLSANADFPQPPH